MTTLISLLNEIRRRAPVGSPLYALRHTRVQHEHLVQLVRRELRFGSRDTHVAAGYCLAASRILSTEHPKGPWSWRPVDEHLCKLYNPGPFVGLGLQFWGRPVVVLETHRWLFTLIAEGGLPIHLVREQGSVISGFFARLLTLAESKSLGSVADELPRCFGMLPESLRNDAVRQLAIDLVSCVRDLRALAHGQDDQMLFLDREMPGWRDRLPLNLDDEVSKQLLSGLLDVPKPQVELTATAIPVFASLQRRGDAIDEYELVHRAQLPQRVSRAGLAGQLGLSAESVSKRFTLSWVTVEGDSIPLATITSSTEEGQLHLDTARRHVTLGRSTGPVLLQATRRGLELGPAVRVSQDVGEMPWVFADDETDQELLSVGPCVTTRKSVLIATTDAAVLRAQADEMYDSGKQHIGTLPDEGRQLYRAHGRIRIEVSGEHFSIRTNATHDEHYAVTKKGARSTLPSGLVWLGIPRFFIQDVRKEQELTPKAISWRPKGSADEWRAISASCIGDVQLRVRWDEQVVHRSNETILSSDFSFELRPGEHSGRGTILLYGLGSGIVHVAHESPELEVEVRKQSHGVFALVCCAHSEVSSVSIRVTFGQTSAELALPFPGHYVGFVDTAGRPLSPGSHLDVARLHAVRARALSARSTDEFVLWARATKMPEVALATLQRGKEGSAELSLGQVQDLVEAMLSHGLDATAQVYLAPKGGTANGVARSRGVKVHWYGNRLTWAAVKPDLVTAHQSETPGTIKLQLKSPNDSDVPVKVFAHQMTDPMMSNRDELPGDESTGWNFVMSERTPGPWIVTAWRGELLLSRPALFVVPVTTLFEDTVKFETGAPPPPMPDSSSSASVSESLVSDATTGSTARDELAARPERESTPALEIAVTETDRAHRQYLMRGAVQRMATNASHPDWNFAQGFLDSMALFPADSYECNRTIFERSEATAMAMLRGAFLGRTEHLWSGFEQFHFLWVTFPLRAWTRAVRVYRNTAFPLVPEESRPPLLKLVMERCFAAGETTQYRAVVWDICARTIFGIPRSPNPIRIPDGQQRSMLARHLAQQEFERVEQAHADESYPQLPATDELLPHSVQSNVDQLYPKVGVLFRRDVARAPALAAAISVHCIEAPRELLFELRRVRDFDPKYFDSVYNDCLACLALDALEENHDHFN